MLHMGKKCRQMHISLANDSSLSIYISPSPSSLCVIQPVQQFPRLRPDHRRGHAVGRHEARAGRQLGELQGDLPGDLPQLQRRALLPHGAPAESAGVT